MTTTSMGAVSTNSDLQAMLALLYKTEENNIGVSKSDLSKINEEQNSEFIKSLEKEFNLIDKDSNGLLTKEEVVNFALDKPLGMPAGFKIQDAASQYVNEKSLYQSIADKVSESIISKLDTDKDGKISQTEIKDAMQNLNNKLNAAASSVEVAGKVANNNSISKVQNMAGNFIQKLIDNYNSGGIVAKLANSAINSFV